MCNRVDESDALMAFDQFLDAKGLLCPEPLMLLHQRVNALSPGEVLKMEVTDPSAQRDVERFCRYLGHALIRVQGSTKQWAFWLRKGDAQAV